MGLLIQNRCQPLSAAVFLLYISGGNWQAKLNVGNELPLSLRAPEGRREAFLGPLFEVMSTA